MCQDANQGENSYDVSVIRPRVLNENIRSRGKGMETSRLAAIKKGLRTLHTLELMATTIYRFQITDASNEHNRQLIAAMCNEMTHYQDFQVKLYEYGFKPSVFRWAFWIVGVVFGLSSRIMGSKAVLKMGIWVESKAVDHYAHLLKTIDWDQDTRKMIQKDQADEDGHILKWKNLLKSDTSES